MRSVKTSIPKAIQTIEYLLENPKVGLACGITGNVLSIAGLALSTGLTIASGVNLKGATKS